MQNVEFRVLRTMDEHSHSLKAHFPSSPEPPHPREARSQRAQRPQRGLPKAGPGPALALSSRPADARPSLPPQVGNPICPSSELMGTLGLEPAACGVLSTEAAPSPQPWAPTVLPRAPPNSQSLTEDLGGKGASAEGLLLSRGGARIPL